MKCGKQLWQDGQYCYDCSRKHFSFDRGFALYNYNEDIRKSIIRFKYKGRGEYAKYYGMEMAKRYGDFLRIHHVNAVFPVPVHTKRLEQRGFNQAKLIGDILCENMGLASLDGMILRVKNTVPQKELDDVGRKKNLEKAFQPNKDFILSDKVKNVVIVDDIYTTGVTINACSKIIKKMFGCKVYFLVLAIGRGL